MAGPLQKVAAGESITLKAETWNTLLETVEKVRRLERTGSKAVSGSLNTAIIPVKNNSGGAVPWHGVLRIDGQTPLIDPGDNESSFRERAAINGDAPDDTGQTFAVMLDATVDGGIGNAAVAGAVPVQIDVTDAAHTFATTVSGDTDKLVSSADTGATILWKESGTGTVWALVLLGGGGGGSSSGGCSQCTMRVYEADDTWEKPANLDYVIVEMVGGGGGGGGVDDGVTHESAGGGGGGGEYRRLKLNAADLSGTEAVAIGAGGDGGDTTPTNGDAGGTTSFGSFDAIGGSGGGNMQESEGTGPVDWRVVSAGPGGSSASPSVDNDLFIAGRPGTNGIRYAGVFSIGGDGGDSQLGAGAKGFQGGSADPGANYGGGGAGASSSGGAQAGGDGAPGVVIIHEYTCVADEEPDTGPPEFIDEFADTGLVGGRTFNGETWDEPNENFIMDGVGNCTVSVSSFRTCLIEANASDILVEASLKLNPSGDASRLGIVARAIGGADFISFELKRYTGPTYGAKLTKREASSESTIDSQEDTDIGYDPTQFQELKMILAGNSIECYLNDELIFTADESFNSTATQVGLVQEGTPDPGVIAYFGYTP